MGPRPPELKESRVHITGLQLLFRGADVSLRADQDLPVQVELQSPQRTCVEVALDLADLEERPAAHFQGEVLLPPGLSCLETLLPAGALPPGRYSMAIVVLGHDFHRCRRLVDVQAAAPPSLALRPRRSRRRRPARRLMEVGLKPLRPGTWAMRPGAMPRPFEAFRVEQLRIQLAESGAEPVLLPCAAAVRMLVRVNLGGLAAGPFIRIRICAPDGVCLVETGTDLWQLPLRSGETVTLNATFFRLNLLPGRYLVLVTVGDETTRGESLGEVHPLHEVEIAELPSPASESQGTLWLGGPLHLQQAEAEVAPQSEGGTRVLSGPRPGPVPQTGHVDLVVGLEPGMQARAWIEDRAGRVLARARTLPVVSQRGVELCWQLRANLPGGSYTLCCAAREPEQGEVKGAVQRFPLEVKGDPALPLRVRRSP